MAKRIVSVFCLFVILFSLSPSVYADDYTNTWEQSNYWEGVLERAVRSTSNWGWGGLVQGLAGLLHGGICRISDDGLHHADEPYRIGEFRKGFTGTESSAVGYCRCKYCGEEFQVTIRASDLQQSYDTQVSELPASIYNSSGALSWILIPDRFSPLNSGCAVAEISGYRLVARCVADASSLSYYCSALLTSIYYAPVSGYYTLSAVTLSSDRLYPTFLMHLDDTYREGRRMRAVLGREISDGITVYRIWRSAGKPELEYPNAENDKYILHVEINGYLAPLGMTDFF